MVFFSPFYFTPLYLQRDEGNKINSQKAGVPPPFIKWCTRPFINFLEFVHLFYKVGGMSSLLIDSNSDMELKGWSKQVDITGAASMFYSMLHVFPSTPLPWPKPPLRGWLMSVKIFNEGIQEPLGVDVQQHSFIWRTPELHDEHPEDDVSLTSKAMAAHEHCPLFPVVNNISSWWFLPSLYFTHLCIEEKQNNFSKSRCSPLSLHKVMHTPIY